MSEKLNYEMIYQGANNYFYDSCATLFKVNDI